MATEADIDAPLTLELDGDDLTPALFLRGARAFFDLVQAVTEAVDHSVIWRVQVKAGSNLIGLWPSGLAPAAAVERIVNSIGMGLETIEREPFEPREFAERGLSSARDLARLGLASGGEVRVKVWAEKRPHQITAQTIAHVDAILSEEFDEVGAVDGRIQTISERGGAKFVVYDWLTDRAIHCVIPPEMLERAMKAFGKRAEVYGTISYDREGRARRIKVEDLVLFPSDDALPSASNVRGLLSNFPR